MAPDVVCNAKFPCFDNSCGGNQTCLVEENDGIPTAYCTCETGFKAVAGNETVLMTDDSLECEDLDECSDDLLNLCVSTQTCINNVGSYECECADGYFENTDVLTNSVAPCVKCSGPGATESDGDCTCNNGSIISENDDTLCVCPNGWQQVGNMCMLGETTTTTTTTSTTTTSTTTSKSTTAMSTSIITTTTITLTETTTTTNFN